MVYDLLYVRPATEVDETSHVDCPNIRAKLNSYDGFRTVTWTERLTLQLTHVGEGVLMDTRNAVPGSEQSTTSAVGSHVPDVGVEVAPRSDTRRAIASVR